VSISFSALAAPTHWLRVPPVSIVLLSASERHSGVVLELGRTAIRIVGLKSARFLPYRPLPFYGVIVGQMGPNRPFAPTPKLLITPNFAVTLQKLARQKINSPPGTSSKPGGTRLSAESASLKLFRFGPLGNALVTGL
jgi:hypothetical protein